MACNEMLHLMKKRKSGSLAFKVDFEKAFDCVRWDFLFEIMAKMGFNQTWINWISECLSSASVSVLINGSPTDEFPMRCGLRQGDPLSQFLFLITVEGLNLMLEEAKSKKLLEGIKVGVPFRAKSELSKVQLNSLPYAAKLDFSSFIDS